METNEGGFSREAHNGSAAIRYFLLWRASTEGALDKLLCTGYVASHGSPPRKPFCFSSPRMPFWGTIQGVERLELLLISTLPRRCDPGGPQSLLIRDGWEDF